MKYLVVVTLFLTSLTSCNPVKKIQRNEQQYQQLVDAYNKEHPLRIDTTTKFLHGKDSVAYYKHISDSLKASQANQALTYRVKYKDTCTSANDTYKEGFDLGYQVGKAACQAIPVHDTVVQTVEQTGMTDRLMIENTALVERIQATKDSRKYWAIAFFCSLLLNILLILFTILLNKKIKAND